MSKKWICLDSAGNKIGEAVGATSRDAIRDAIDRQGLYELLVVTEVKDEPAAATDEK